MCVGSSLLLATATAALAQSEPITIRAARVIDGRGQVMTNTTITVRGSKIAIVDRSTPGTITYDLGNLTLLPGFIDTHYHSMWLIPEIHPGQIWQYLTTLSYGVTTTRDPQTGSTDVLSYQDRVETGDMLGPRVYSTGPGVFAQDHQSLRVVSQAQLLRRAHHAVRFDTANLADLDGEWFLLTGLQGQRCAGQDERDFVAGFEVLGAANDLALAFAVVHAAERELVGVGVFVLGDDLYHHYALELTAELVNTLDFEPKHGELPGQFFGRPVKRDVLFEPVKGDFHRDFESSVRSFLGYL